jgi:hypothetical protein
LPTPSSPSLKKIQKQKRQVINVDCIRSVLMFYLSPLGRVCNIAEGFPLSAICIPLLPLTCINKLGACC